MSIQMGKKIALLTGLLISGCIAAVVLWMLVYLPARVVEPIVFTPVEISEGSITRVQEKMERFVNMGQTSVELDQEELSILLKSNLEEQLNIDISEIFVGLSPEGITAIIETRVTDIPSSGYLGWLLQKRDVEYTTTLISAEVWSANGNLAYRIHEFRIGKFKVPPFLLMKITGGGSRSFEKVSITKLEIRDDHLYVERD